MKSKALAGSALAALMGIGVLAGSVIGNSSASAQSPPPHLPPPSQRRAPPPPHLPIPQQRYPVTGEASEAGADTEEEMVVESSAARLQLTARPALSPTPPTASPRPIATLHTPPAKWTPPRCRNGSMEPPPCQRAPKQPTPLLNMARLTHTPTPPPSWQGRPNSVMAKALGAANLPSYADRPQHGDKDLGTAAASITQAQASRILAETYNNLVAKSAAVTSASNAGEAAPYLADASTKLHTMHTARAIMLMLRLLPTSRAS